DVGRGVRRNVVSVGEPAAQATAVDPAGAKLCALPKIGGASRSCPRLGVVGVDVIVGDVGQLVVAEQILVGHYVLCDLAGPSDVPVGAEVAILVSRAQLNAGVIAP